jgi:ketosteroid isomerase-like protein
MQICSRQTLALVVLAFLWLGTVVSAANAQTAEGLPPEVLRANQELDRKFLEAHLVPDNTDALMDLFTASPDIFVIGPTGIIDQGRDQVRQSIEKFFARVVTMTGVIDHVTYLPAGDGVIAYGQVTYHRQLRGGASDQRIVVWSDYRRKENGKWVIVFRHPQWPLAGNSLPCATQPAAAGH